MKTTKDQRAEWLRLEQEATPGPWLHSTVRACIDTAQLDADGQDWDAHSIPMQDVPPQDAAVIAAARNALRPLIEDVEELEQSLRTVQDMVLDRGSDRDYFRQLCEIRALARNSEAAEE